MLSVLSSPKTEPAPNPSLPLWPMNLMVMAYPLWFVLGLSGFMWIGLAVPMFVALMAQPRVVVPKGFGWWAIFVLAVIGSAIGIDTVGRGAGYVVRLGYYVGAGVVLVYIINGGRSVGAAKVVKAFTVLWLATVAGGWLALVMGEFSFRAPLYYVLPPALLSNDLVKSLVTPGFADVQNIIGVSVPRPKAPFPYTNSWGSMLALLTPFAMMSLADREVKISPRLVRFGLAASIVPAVISLNRGLWLSLGVGVIYVAVRLGVGGRTTVLLRLLMVVSVVIAVIALTPLGDLIITRFSTGHSNGDRTDLALAAINGAAERPFFGWGAPRPNVRNLPSIGTHGQLWMVIFSHGFVGLVGFLGALLVFWARTAKQATTAGLWAHTVIVIALVQTPVYLMVPGQVFVVMAAVGVALRYQASPPSSTSVDSPLDLTGVGGETPGPIRPRW